METTPVALVVILAVVVTIALADVLLMQRVLIPKICDHFERPPAFNVVPAQPLPAALPITFKAADGLLLHGCLMNSELPDPPGLVLFLPEHRGNHWTAYRYCQALIDQGYVILAFDFRNQGESESLEGYSPSHWMTEYEMQDVAAAMEFIGSHHLLSTLPIITFGVSRGGVAALLAACRYHRIRGVIADSAFGTITTLRFFADRFAGLYVPESLFRFFPEWHISGTLRRVMALSERRRNCHYVHLEDEVHHLESRSVLLISGSADSYISTEVARRLQQLAGSGTQLWIARGARHNSARLLHTEEYDRRVRSHAARCLQSDSTPVADLTVEAEDNVDASADTRSPHRPVARTA
ncbi:MAG: alpha/beta hydrolase [Planctomycetaceae bacterium]